MPTLFRAAPGALPLLQPHRLGLSCLMRLMPGLLLALLCACKPAVIEPDGRDLARADSMRPATPALAERYERSCMTCHAQRASGAPLTGFAPQWQERRKKGMAELEKNAINGFNAMPAKGACNDCSAEDIRALIEFMAGA